MGLYVLFYTIGKKNRYGITMPRRLAIILWPLLAFQLFQFISNFQHLREPPLELLVRDIGALLWVSLSMVFITNRNDLSRTLWAYCLALIAVHLGIIANGIGLVSFDFGTQSEQKVRSTLSNLEAFRSAGFLVNFGEISIFTAFAAPWLISMLFRMKTTWSIRCFSLLAIATVAAGSIISLSRNVWASAAIAIIVFLLMRVYKYGRNWSRITMLFAAPILFSLSMPLIAPLLTNLYGDAVDIRAESVNDRVLQYRAAISEIRSNPLFGPGPGYVYNNVEIHNIFLNAFIHSGIGGIFLSGLLIYVLYRLFKRIQYNDQLSAAVFSGYCGSLVAASFYPVILNSAPIFWLTFGIGAAAATLPAETQKTHLIYRSHFQK